MSERTHQTQRDGRTTRRAFLRTVPAVGGLAALAGCLNDESSAQWIAVEAPSQGELYDVAESREGPVAVGEGGRVLARRDGGWTVAVKNGVAGEQNALRDAASSDNGRHVWVAGDSGVVGLYDVDERKLTDYSAPEGKTSTWEAVAVIGLADAEWVYLANGSGEVMRGAHTDGKIEWTDPVKPGGGSSATSVEFTGRGLGFVTDTSSNVLQTIDGGQTWRRIGIQRGAVNLYDIAPLHSDEIDVVGDGGAIFSYNGFTWTRRNAGEDALTAIVRNRHRGVVVSDVGAAFHLTTNGWVREQTAAEDALHGVTLGNTEVPSVAVGDGGTVLERHEQ